MKLKKIILAFIFSSFVFCFGVFIGEYSLLKFRKKTYILYEHLYPLFQSYLKRDDIPLLKIELKESDLKKIKLKRSEGLLNNYLTHNKKDYVKAKFYWNNDTLKGKLRLKGGFKDHYEDAKKWSFRVKLKNESIKNTSSFSLQHPKTRNYLNEWIFQKYIQHVNLIEIDYEFITVQINNEYLGVYAFEEGFSNKLLQKNDLPIAPIIKFNKGRFILDYKDLAKVEENNNWFDFSNDEYLNSKIEIYNDENFIDDSLFVMNFKKARELLDSYRKNEILASSVFDKKKMSKYIAAINIFSGFHGVNWNNMRFYFNPKTSKLEPISYDSNSSYNLEISPSKTEQLLLTRFLFNDTSFFISYIKELNYMANKSNFEKFFSSIREELQQQENIVSSEFFNYDDYPSIIYKKTKIINKVIKNTFISDVSGCLENNYIIVYNSNKFPVELVRIEKDDSTVHKFSKNNIIFKKPYLTSPEKIKYDVPLNKFELSNKLYLIYKVVGRKEEKKVRIEYFLCE
jgi:hypothetical protein